MPETTPAVPAKRARPAKPGKPRKPRKKQRSWRTGTIPVTLPPWLLKVIPLSQWCAARGVSYDTARRLNQKGRLKLTDLSAGRVGVREDHDKEYLDSCLRQVEPAE
jgi:hypothetical protein